MGCRTKNGLNFFLAFSVLFLALTGCATLADRNKWETVSVKKVGWPERYESWTYKRCCGQELVWTLFGNDTDGVTPPGWDYWDWWLRNRWSNWGKYKIGFMMWREGDPYAGWETNHLDYRPIVDHDGFFFSIIKPKKRSGFFWRPFIGACIGKLCAWWGWQKRGMYCNSIRWTDDPPWR